MEPQPSQNAASDFGYAMGQSIRQTSLLGGIWLGVKAGRNHFERTGDWQESAWLGAIAGRRWFVWILACWLILVQGLLGMWFVSLVNSPGFHDFSETGEARSWAYALAITPCVMVPLMGVLYNRNVDFSLFQRRSLYRLIRPLASALNGLSNVVIYAGLIVLPITISYVV